MCGIIEKVTHVQEYMPYERYAHQILGSLHACQLVSIFYDFAGIVSCAQLHYSSCASLNDILKVQMVNYSSSIARKD